MTIEKLPSGAYRVRKQIDGIRYTVITPYRPSKKEAHQLIEDRRTGKDILKKTFGMCAREYIDGKLHTLSPSTIRSYEGYIRKIPDSFQCKELGDITAWDIQLLVDKMSADGLSPKTIRNYHGFISAVFATFRPDMPINTKLPQKLAHDSRTPTDNDIKKILAESKGTIYEIPLRLACYGLRRSEICALTADDLKGNRLSINKACVLDRNNHWTIKTTKTTSSTRTIIIDSGLADMIREKGVIYEGYPNTLYTYLQKTQEKLGIERFPLHYFRHYYASTMHQLGVPDAVIMETGGWKTDHVMKRVYRHAKESEAEQQKLLDHLKNML